MFPTKSVLVTIAWTFAALAVANRVAVVRGLIYGNGNGA